MTQTMSEVKVLLEENKSKKVYLTLTERANLNLEKQQNRFFKRTGGKITKVNLINKVLETATI